MLRKMAGIMSACVVQETKTNKLFDPTRRVLVVSRCTTSVSKSGSPSHYRDPIGSGMERVGAKRAVRRALNTRLKNEVTTEHDNNAAEVVSLQYLINRLSPSANELEAVNRAIEEFIPIKAVESEYTGTMGYEEVAISALSFLRESMIA